MSYICPFSLWSLFLFLWGRTVRLSMCHCHGARWECYKIKRDKSEIQCHVINWVLQNTEKEANLPLSTDVRTLRELIASGQEALLLTVWPGSVPGPRWRSAPDSCYRLALAMSLHCFGPLKHPYNSSTVLNYSIHRHARTRSLVVVHTWRHP